MTNKLYNADYLEQTAILFKELKALSYAPFSALENGTIADIGCGVGIDAINLASLLEENGIKVIGIDSDELLIQRGIDSNEKTANLEFLTADTEALPFNDNSLSGIRNERLIQHLEHPDIAFNEFYRVLQPEAPIVIVETDWTSLSFYNGDYKLTQKIKEYFPKHIARNSFAAANLSYFLEEHGFKEIGLRLFPIISNSLEQVISLTKIDYILEKMKEEGLLAEAEFNDFWRSLQKAGQEQYFVCSINLILATAFK